MRASDVAKQLRANFASPPQNLERHWGTITSIAIDGTVSVTKGGSAVSISGVRCMTTYTPVMYQTVMLDVIGSDMIVVGAIAAPPPVAPAFTSATNPTFIIGTPVSFLVVATGSPAPTVTLASGTVPPGLTYVNGLFSGTPTAGSAGTYLVTFTAVNGISPSASLAMLIVIATSASIAPSITSSASTSFSTTGAGSFQMTATGYPAPTWSQTGTLPSGVTLSSAGLLAGTPAGGSGGTYALVVTATNSTAAVTQNFTLTVGQAPTITSAATTTFGVGTSGLFTVTTSGGTPVPVMSYTGTLPAGVTFVDNNNGTATISGTPAPGTAASYPLTLAASNGVGVGGGQAFTLTVSAGGSGVWAAVQSPTVPAASTSVAGATGITLAYTANVTANNRMVAVTSVTSTLGAAGATATVTDSAANTWTRDAVVTGAVGHCEIAIWSAPITLGGGTKPTVKMTATGGTAPYQMALAIGEYSGLSTASGATAVDVSAVATEYSYGTTTNVLLTTAAATTTASNELMVVAAGDYGDGETLNATGTGTVKRGSNAPDPNETVWMADKDTGAAASQTGSVNIATGTGGNLSALMVVYKLGGTAPAPTAPTVPTGVTATPGNASAQVSWNAPYNGGRVITSYTVTPL